MDIQKSNNPLEYFEFEGKGWAVHIEGYNDAFGALTAGGSVHIR